MEELVEFAKANGVGFWIDYDRESDQLIWSTINVDDDIKEVRLTDVKDVEQFISQVKSIWLARGLTVCLKTHPPREVIK